MAPPGWPPENRCLWARDIRGITDSTTNGAAAINELEVSSKGIGVQRTYLDPKMTEEFRSLVEVEEEIARGPQPVEQADDVVYIEYFAN
jgi:hypothetical protein